MSLSKAEKKKLRAMNAERIKIGQAPIKRVQAKEKPAPAVATQGHQDGQARPRREPEAHPLDKIKAKLIDAGGAAAWGAGNTLRVLFEKLARSGLDSTQALASGAGGGGSRYWTQEQVDIVKSLTTIKDELPDWEFAILRKVCGEGWPIPAAIHYHAKCHEDGTFMMFWNSLEHLQSALTRANVSWAIHRDAAEQGRMGA